MLCMGYYFENILGKFDFTSKFRLSKKKGEIVIDEKSIGFYSDVLQFFKKEEFWSKFRTENIKLTSSDLGKSVDNDYLIREKIKEVDNLVKARSRVKDVELLKEFARTLIVKEKELGLLMEKHCPNLLAVADALIGARLLQIAGSLKKLSLMSPRKIQVLGAEAAFFKFLTKKGQKMPKYGALYHHSLVVGSEEKGRVARLLADKIAIAVKVDYFKGEFIGKKLRKEVEDKLD